MFAINDPMAIPGQVERPNKIINAKAIPDGGHAGSAVEFSNAKKYPSLAAK